MTVKQIARDYPMGKATEQNIRHRLRLLELPPNVQLEVHAGKVSQDAALKLLGEGKRGKKEPPLSRDEKAHEGGGPEGGAVEVAEEREVEGQAASAGAGALPSRRGRTGGLRRLLQDFIDRLEALDLSRAVETLLRLAGQLLPLAARSARGMSLTRRATARSSASCAALGRLAATTLS
jgi:hypothetical protein